MEKMIFCNHYSNCRLLLTPIILTLYLTFSISSTCTLVHIHYDIRCSTFLDMSTVSIMMGIIISTSAIIFKILFLDSGTSCDIKAYCFTHVLCYLVQIHCKPNTKPEFKFNIVILTQMIWLIINSNGFQRLITYHLIQS
jgi:hypothetical protein